MNSLLCRLPQTTLNGVRMLKRTVDLEAHTQILQSLRLKAPGAVLDGPVVPSRYAMAEPRILWILREANGGRAWDLRDFLADDKRLRGYSRWHATFGLVAKVSHGLLQDWPAARVGRLRADSVVDALRQVAVVNVNKQSGRSTVNWDRLFRNASRFESDVAQQIRALAPDIIIAAGTADLIPAEVRASLSAVTGRKIAAVSMSNTWLVKCPHPGQRKMRHGDLYSRIRSALVGAGWQCGNEEGRAHVVSGSGNNVFPAQP